MCIASTFIIINNRFIVYEIDSKNNGLFKLPDVVVRFKYDIIGLFINQPITNVTCNSLVMGLKIKNDLKTVYTTTRKMGFNSRPE